MTPHTFIIAEAGVNHNGSLGLAYQLVDAAVAAGADAVKFQTFKAEKLATRSAAKADYQKRSAAADETQLEMLRKLELDAAAHEAIIAYCQQKHIQFLSTPFDEDSADLLDALGVPQYKVSSGDLTNLPLLHHLARKGKPLMLSTGMSYLSEVEQAVRAIQAAGNPPTTLLHCVSNYPADFADTNLHAMATLRAAFGLPVGYSDHTPGIEVPIAAVALGATVIEKHFTLDRTLPGPDHQSSLEPEELRQMVASIRHIEVALGHGRKEPTAAELSTAAVARKSIVAARDLAAGTVLTPDMLTIKRPGTGLAPRLLEFVLGRTLREDIAADTLITLEMLR